MAMFGKKGAELVREAKQALATMDQFRPFNKDLFDQVVKETEEHSSHLQERMSQISMNEPAEGVDPSFIGGCAQHMSVLRNKRCLLAYINARMSRIQQLRWDLGAVLPDDITESLSSTERTFFQGYSDALNSYMTDINLDLTVDATPPKDPYVQIRVIGNLGEVLLDDQETSLLPHSIHFMTRTEAEPLVLQIQRLYASRFFRGDFPDQFPALSLPGQTLPNKGSAGSLSGLKSVKVPTSTPPFLATKAQPATSSTVLLFVTSKLVETVDNRSRLCCTEVFTAGCAFISLAPETNTVSDGTENLAHDNMDALGRIRTLGSRS